MATPLSRLIPSGSRAAYQAARHTVNTGRAAVRNPEIFLRPIASPPQANPVLQARRLYAQHLSPTQQLPAFNLTTPLAARASSFRANSNPAEGLALLARQEEDSPIKNVISRIDIASQEEKKTIRDGVIYQDLGAPCPQVNQIELKVTLPKKPSPLALRIATGLGKALAFLVTLPFRIALFPLKKTCDLGVHLLFSKSPTVTAEDFAYNPDDFNTRFDSGIINPTHNTSR